MNGHEEIVGMGCTHKRRTQRVNGCKERGKAPGTAGRPAQSRVAREKGGEEAQDQGSVLELPRAQLVKRRQVDARTEIIEVWRVSKRMNSRVERVSGLAGKWGKNTALHLANRVGHREAIVIRLAGPHQSLVEERPSSEQSDGKQTH